MDVNPLIHTAEDIISNHNGCQIIDNAVNKLSNINTDETVNKYMPKENISSKATIILETEMRQRIENEHVQHTEYLSMQMEKSSILNDSLTDTRDKEDNENGGKCSDEEEEEKEEEQVDEMENIDEEWNIETYWSNFAQESTVHGIGNLSGPKLRIILWAIVIIGCFTYLIYTLIEEFTYYYSYPVNYISKLKFHDRLNFPAVTLCNLNWRNGTKINNTIQDDIYYSAISTAKFLLSEVNWTDEYYKENGYYSPINESVYIKDAIDSSKFLQKCWFDTEYFENCVSHFKPIVTSVGLCYTFNAEGSKSTAFSGSDYNLHMYIDVAADTYTWSQNFDKGIQVVVHDPNTYPEIKSHGFRVQPGLSAYAEVGLTHLRFKGKPYKAYENYFCENTLKGWTVRGRFFNYSRYLCLHRCYANNVMEVCNCRHVSDQIEGPICSRYEYERCYLHRMNTIVGNSTLTRNCQCLLPCRSNKFTTSVSTATFPSDFIERQFERIGNPGWKRMKQNAIFLRVYFNELTTEYHRQRPKYVNAADILANLGGQMGLFLGASILSVIEIAEFCIIALGLAVKRLRNRWHAADVEGNEQ